MAEVPGEAFFSKPGLSPGGAERFFAGAQNDKALAGAAEVPGEAFFSEPGLSPGGAERFFAGAQNAG